MTNHNQPDELSDLKQFIRELLEIATDEDGKATGRIDKDCVEEMLEKAKRNNLLKRQGK